MQNLAQDTFSKSVERVTHAVAAWAASASAAALKSGVVTEFAAGQPSGRADLSSLLKGIIHSAGVLFWAPN